MAEAISGLRLSRIRVTLWLTSISSPASNIYTAVFLIVIIVDEIL
jgi:hypothetical protein